MVLIKDMYVLYKRFEYRYEIFFIFMVEVGLKFFILVMVMLILCNVCFDLLILFREE